METLERRRLEIAKPMKDLKAEAESINDHAQLLINLHLVILYNEEAGTIWSTERTMVRVSDIAGRSEGVEGLKSLAKSIADVVWLATHDVRKSHIRAFLPEVIMEKTTDKFKVRSVLKSAEGRKCHRQSEAIEKVPLNVTTSIQSEAQLATSFRKRGRQKERDQRNDQQRRC